MISIDIDYLTSMTCFSEEVNSGEVRELSCLLFAEVEDLSDGPFELRLLPSGGVPSPGVRF